MRACACPRSLLALLSHNLSEDLACSQCNRNCSSGEAVLLHPLASGRCLTRCPLKDGGQSTACVLYQRSLAPLSFCRRNDLLVSELSVPTPGSQPLKFDRPFAASTLEQFKVLMTRWLRSYWRHPGYNATRFAFCVVLAVLLGTIYLWMGQKR